MELFSNYKTKLLQGDDKESDNDYKSETSLATSLGGDVDYNDLFGNTDVAVKSGAPVKGRKYLLFTVVMCIVLSIMVVLNSSSEGMNKGAVESTESQGLNVAGGDANDDTTTDTAGADTT